MICSGPVDRTRVVPEVSRKYRVPRIGLVDGVLVDLGGYFSLEFQLHGSVHGFFNPHSFYSSLFPFRNALVAKCCWVAGLLRW